MNLSAQKKLLEIIDQLDATENYVILCHSSQKEEVQSWDLPYKIIANSWTNSIFDDMNKVYIVPSYSCNDLSIKYYCEDIDIDKEYLLHY